MSDDICERLVRFAGKVCISTDTEVEAADTIEALRAENVKLREATLEEAAKAAEGFPKNREWVPGSLYDTLRREVARDIRRLK